MTTITTTTLNTVTLTAEQIALVEQINAKFQAKFAKLEKQQAQEIAKATGVKRTRQADPAKKAEKEARSAAWLAKKIAAGNKRAEQAEKRAARNAILAEKKAEKDAKSLAFKNMKLAVAARREEENAVKAEKARAKAEKIAANIAKEQAKLAKLAA